MTTESTSMPYLQRKPAVVLNPSENRIIPWSRVPNTEKVMNVLSLVPLVNTVTAIAFLILKTINLIFSQKRETKNSYLGRICSTNFLKIAVLSVPLLGNLAVAFHLNKMLRSAKQKTYSPIPILHDRARGPRPGYPEKSKVLNHQISWKIPFLNYTPTLFTKESLLGNSPPKTADPISPKDINWTERASHTGKILFDEKGYPLNPVGRTGMTGRGFLYKWGPNFAADPIVTRVNPDTQKREALLIQRDDTLEWAIPGGMVDPGEVVTKTLSRELGEEAFSGEDKQEVRKLLEELFKNPDIVYQGYVDDPRNTDNAWMETTAAHIHLSDDLAQKLDQAQAGSDAKTAKWTEITPELKLYASHKNLIDLALSRLEEGDLF